VGIPGFFGYYTNMERNLQTNEYSIINVNIKMILTVDESDPIAIENKFSKVGTFMSLIKIKFITIKAYYHVTSLHIFAIF
jgi:hypothetical protein